MDVIDLVTAGGRLDIPDTCPAPISDMMTSCWTRNADQRPSFTDIVLRLQVAAALSLNRLNIVSRNSLNVALVVYSMRVSSIGDVISFIMFFCC